MLLRMRNVLWFGLMETYGGAPNQCLFNEMSIMFNVHNGLCLFREYIMSYDVQQIFILQNSQYLFYG